MTHAQALIHGDLHTGSIMVNEHETRIIDPEFAFCGPMGYDVGAVLENLVLSYLSHYAHTIDPKQRADYQAYLLRMVRDIWDRFVLKFEALWQENNTGELPQAAFWAFPGGQEAFADFRRRYIQRILCDTAGHGGCKMLRRMMGIVNVWDITSLGDLQKRAHAERAAIRIGSRWVLERDRICGVEDLIGIVREETTNGRL
jgi:5-methylthioribose kinase